MTRVMDSVPSGSYHEAMKHSATLVTVSGIGIKVHVTFLLLLLYVAVEGWLERGPAGAAFGVFLTLALFACVVLHELGHSFTAKGFGISVGQILLLPIGGVSSLSQKPKNPIQEILIAAAGPAVSLALALVFYRAAGSPPLTGRGLLVQGNGADLSPATTAQWLFRANLVLAFFNMIPAFPMDGGRVFRAFLRIFLGEPRATSLAAGVGRLFAVVLGLAGILAGNMLLALVAFFLYFAGTGEAAGEAIEETLRHIRAGTVCTHFGTVLGTSDTLHRVMELVLGSEQRNFPVLEDGVLAGVLESRTLREKGGALRPDTPVASLMKKNVPVIQADQDLGKALEELRRTGAGTCGVLEGSRFLGLLDESRIRLALSLSPGLVSEGDRP
jgi:Zn-dependent protease